MDELKQLVTCALVLALMLLGSMLAIRLSILHAMHRFEQQPG